MNDLFFCILNTSCIYLEHIAIKILKKL
ncbi:unnamed protein product [Leptidea sinapis]|uniref:Uncharacterized protein n=1 Tax=Leptidea sinapis TaxID=189913 RepID=A0A5E4QMH1_9NEOP|nr:unnamed protein product [Leptidea sinapis]